MVKHVFLVAIGVAALGSGLAVPAQAQAPGRALVVYGNDPCPANTICVRSPESERYRIPKALRGSSLTTGQSPGRNAATSLVGGVNTGPASCSNVGGGGGSSCLSNQIRSWNAEKKANADAAAASPEPR